MIRIFRTGNATIILLIVALVVGVVSTILIITITRTNPKTQSSAAPVTTTLLPSVPKSTASGQTTFAPPTTTPAPTTVTTTTLAAGEISTSTLLSTDRTQLAVDFIAASFTGINNITYTIAYTADVSGLATTKNIQGTFAIASTLVTGYKTNGYPYIRKTFTLGTCSGTACTYDTNPRTFQVSVTAN